MHSTRRIRANSPKGGDAKPPVYGTYVPTTAGLPVRTLTHSAARSHALQRVRFSRSPRSRVFLAIVWLCASLHKDAALDKAQRFWLTRRARSQRMTSSMFAAARRVAAPKIRETPHVQFNFALLR